MSHELTKVLQEESERIAGKHLPTEVCWLIMLKCGGMVSPSAMAVKEAKQIERVTSTPDITTWETEFVHWLWKCNDRVHDSEYALLYPLPKWVNEEIGNQPSSLWPYATKQARLEGIKRGDYPHWALPNSILFDRTARGGVYYILGVYEGPCPRCGAKSTLTIENLQTHWMRTTMLSFRLECAHGHLHRDYMEFDGVDASVTYCEPVRAYFNTLGIGLRGVRRPGE